ncbi:MAG: glycosyltransferase family 9 protein [Roseivirga sp.]|nr:glycosyltransferase family 9 protein [Roseivirga sp.]
MKIETIRWVDVKIGRILCFLLTVWRKLTLIFGKPPQHKPERILFIKFIEQGATVIAYSAIKRAIDEVGRENVFFCVFEANRPILDLINILPDENIITIKDDSLGAFTIGSLKALLRIRRLKIDATVDMEFFSRASAIFAYLSGAKQRVGLHRYTSEYSYRGKLMTHEVQHNAYLHTARAYALLVACLFNGKQETPAPKIQKERLPIIIPQFEPDAEKERAFREKLASEADETLPSRIILVNTNSSDMLPLRRWELDKFTSLTQRLLTAEPSALIVLTGTAEEAPNAEQIQGELKSSRLISMAGKTSMEELLYLYDMADLLVTNDSGPAHFASMTKTEVLVLFGPETPQLYGPIGGRIHIIWKALSCSPCINAINHRFSPCTDNQCMKQISVDEVFERALQILRLKNQVTATSPS